MKPLHRDDIPFEVVEQIEHSLREAYPDKKLVFAGDTDDPETIARSERIHAKLAERGQESRRDGFCVDCWTAMPNYSNEPAEGWAHLEDQEGTFMGWLCPMCCGPDGKQEVRPVFLEDFDEREP